MDGHFNNNNEYIYENDAARSNNASAGAANNAAGNSATGNNATGNGAAGSDSGLKEEWKGVGKGLGKTFSGLGKTLIRTGKLGLEKADDWAEGREGVDHSADTAAMKEGWTNFGNDFVDSAKGVGKTTVKSVKTGVDSVSNEGNGEAKQ